MKILNVFVNILKHTTATALLKICEMLNNAIKFLSDVKTEQKKVRNEKRNSEYGKIIDKACDDGDLRDLLDIKNKILGLAAAIFTMTICGCASVSIQTAAPWEGRYSSQKDVAKAVQLIKLEKGESAWLLSSRTLKTILKENMIK